jgi:hypothetical protein
MKLSTQTIINLANALASLNSHPEVVKEGEKHATVQRPYSFAPMTRLAIAKNLAKCQAVSDAYQKVRAGLIVQVSGGKSDIQPPPVVEKDKPDYQSRVDTFTEQITEFTRINQMFMDEKHEVDLVLLSEDALKLDANPIPFATLAQMAAIMEGEGWGLAEEVRFTSAPAPDKAALQ